MTSKVSWRGHQRSLDFTDLEVFSGGSLIPEFQWDYATDTIQQIIHRASEWVAVYVPDLHLTVDLFSSNKRRICQLSPTPIFFKIFRHHVPDFSLKE